MSAITAKQNVIISKLDRIIDLLQPKIAYEPPIDEAKTGVTLPVEVEVSDHVNVPMSNAGGDDGKDKRVVRRGRPRKVG